MTSSRSPKDVAARAVARGVAWLDTHIAGWRDRIDVAELDLQWPCECVLGQLEDDFYQAVWTHRFTRAKVYALGFAAPKGLPYRTLTAAWRRVLRDRPIS